MMLDDLDEFQPDPDDVARQYPAARCRGCGVVTHTCTVGSVRRLSPCRRCTLRGIECMHGARLKHDRDQEYHLDDGWRLGTVKHARGCSRPPGRLDLLLMMRDQAPELADTALGARLQRFMMDGEVEAAAAELLEYLENRP